jgi:hypothetical protein
MCWSDSGRRPVDEQVQLVDEVVLKQSMHELAAAVGEDVAAGLALECPYCIDGLSRMMLVLRHSGFSNVRDTTYFITSGLAPDRARMRRREGRRCDG